jgi:hypothetical protein
MPAKYRAIRRALQQYPQFRLEVRQGKGSHIVISDQEGRTFSLSLHRGEHSEITDVYIRALCRTFELDYDEFKKRL